MFNFNIIVYGNFNYEKPTEVQNGDILDFVFFYVAAHDGAK
jgi:hypothetical protein